MGAERTKQIPMEVLQSDGTPSSSLDNIIEKWQNTFEQLYQACPQNSSNDSESSTVSDMEDPTAECLNEGISIIEVAKAVESLNKNKAAGYDGIPAEVLQRETCIYYLHRLFCLCFETAKIPKSWSYGLITPVLKDSLSDKRDPKNYRGITVTSAVYKAYCCVLNEKLTK